MTAYRSKFIWPYIKKEARPIHNNGTNKWRKLSDMELKIEKDDILLIDVQVGVLYYHCESDMYGNISILYGNISVLYGNISVM